MRVLWIPGPVVFLDGITRAVLDDAGGYVRNRRKAQRDILFQACLNSTWYRPLRNQWAAGGQETNRPKGILWRRSLYFHCSGWKVDGTLYSGLAIDIYDPTSPSIFSCSLGFSR